MKIQQQQQQKQKKFHQTCFVKHGIQGAALMGKTYAVIGAIITVVLAVLLLVYGSILLSNPHTVEVSATIKTATCTANVSKDMYSCNLSVEYTIPDNNELFQKQISEYKTYEEVLAGDVLTLYADPSNPDSVQGYKVPSWIGILMIVFGILIIFFTFLYLFFIFRYKALATLSGLTRVVDNA